MGCGHSTIIRDVVYLGQYLTRINGFTTIHQLTMKHFRYILTISSEIASSSCCIKTTKYASETPVHIWLVVEPPRKIMSSSVRMMKFSITGKNMFQTTKQTSFYKPASPLAQRIGVAPRARMVPGIAIDVPWILTYG